MNGRTTWGHANENNRKGYGLEIEEKFQLEVLCSCGRHFVKSPNPFTCDFVCKICKTKVDVKFSPKTQQTWNITISANAWNKYANDTLIVTYASGTWYGAEKWDIQVNDEHESTHPD